MQKPLLEATGQRRGLFNAGGLLFGGFGVASLSPLLFSRDQFDGGIVMLALGALMMVGASVMAQRATTCPRCSLRWLQYAIHRVGAGNWLRWLLTLTQCPRCGYTSTMADRGRK